ncbi:hypothetical protein ACW0JT_18365 [Arthrobacter sp. SA17]
MNQAQIERPSISMKGRRKGQRNPSGKLPEAGADGGHAGDHGLAVFLDHLEDAVQERIKIAA